MFDVRGRRSGQGGARGAGERSEREASGSERRLASPHKGCCSDGGGTQSQARVHGPEGPWLSTGLRAGVGTPALPPTPPGRPAPLPRLQLPRAPGGMEEGWLSVAEPQCRRYAPVKHPASCGRGLKTFKPSFGFDAGAQGPLWGWGDGTRPRKMCVQLQRSGREMQRRCPQTGFYCSAGIEPFSAGSFSLRDVQGCVGGRGMDINM